MHEKGDGLKGKIEDPQDEFVLSYTHLEEWSLAILGMPQDPPEEEEREVPGELCQEL